MKRLRVLFLISLALLLKTFPAQCQPQISGNLSGILGPGEYVVVGDCQVPETQSLIIQPGTTLMFSGHYFFRVYGELCAQGTPSDSIKFIRQFPTEDCRHGGIRFYNSPTANNSLSYCWIDNASNVNYPNSIGGGIFCDHVDLEISNSIVSNCFAYIQGAGLYTKDCTAFITDCVFMGNSSGNGAGIFLDNCEAASTVKNCIFVRNLSTST